MSDSIIKLVSAEIKADMETFEDQLMSDFDALTSATEEHIESIDDESYAYWNDAKNAITDKTAQETAEFAAQKETEVERLNTLIGVDGDDPVGIAEIATIHGAFKESGDVVAAIDELLAKTEKTLTGEIEEYQNNVLGNTGDFNPAYVAASN